MEPEEEADQEHAGSTPSPSDTNMNIKQLKEAVFDRIAWRTLAYQVAESRTRLNGLIIIINYGSL